MTRLWFFPSINDWRYRSTSILTVLQLLMIYPLTAVVEDITFDPSSTVTMTNRRMFLSVSSTRRNIIVLAQMMMNCLSNGWFQIRTHTTQSNYVFRCVQYLISKQSDGSWSVATFIVPPSPHLDDVMILWRQRRGESPLNVRMMNIHRRINDTHADFAGLQRK